MHELGVTQRILEIALAHAQGRRITDIYLVIGEMSSMVDDSVQFYWEIIAQDSPAQDAVLHFERVQAEFQCEDCQAVYLLRESDLICPRCGSSHVRLVRGDEFYLAAIDVDEEKEGQYADENTGC
jgi:hydrogenase nickel incorporation protein HypA/HybF